MRNLPNRPIFSASVYFAGERAAGLSSHTYNLDLWIDLNVFSEKDAWEHLEEMRKSIYSTYELMLGEPPTWVMFDFESDAP